MFVCHVYGGRASDRFIVRCSEFCKYLEKGGELIADGGFVLSDEMKAKRIRLNIPAFTLGRLRLHEKEVTPTRRIASLRIHVEKAINCIKAFGILKQSVPIHHRALVNEVVKVCAGLCNMKSPLIQSKL